MNTVRVEQQEQLWRLAATGEPVQPRSKAQNLGLRQVLSEAEQWARESGIEWGAFMSRFTYLMGEEKVASLDAVKVQMADLLPDKPLDRVTDLVAEEIVHGHVDPKDGLREMAEGVEADPGQFGRIKRNTQPAPSDSDEVDDRTGPPTADTVGTDNYGVDGDQNSKEGRRLPGD